MDGEATLTVDGALLLEVVLVMVEIAELVVFYTLVKLRGKNNQVAITH